MFKDYSNSLAFFKKRLRDVSEKVGGDRNSQVEAYAAAIEALELVNPIRPDTKTIMIICPRCHKEYTRRNAQELTHGERICSGCGQHLKW